MFIFPPERSEEERRGASFTPTGSPTLTKASKSNQNNYEFPPITDRQEEKNNFLLTQGYGR